MDKKINKIIVITAYPFNQRDYDRFGIEILRTNGLNVEIWDITSCLDKNLKDQLVVENSINFENLIIFEEKSDIVNAISSLSKDGIINCFIEYSLRTFFIFRAISKYNINYCVFGMVSFPSPYVVKNNYIERIILILEKGNSLKFKEIIQHILNKVILRYYFIFGISPASIILLGGAKSPGIPSYPVSNTTLQLWTHMLDYDIYLQDKPELNVFSKKTGVFLDQYLPLHPDYLYEDNESPLSVDNYYSKLCDFFTTLEKNMNVDIVIAAHPRSDYDNLPDYFNTRTIIKGKTAHIVNNSSFVIAHASTAVNFAVLYHKPIVFITTDELEKMASGKNITGLYIQAIALELGKKPINIDHLSKFDCDKEMEINEGAYLSYRSYYIKKPGTPEKPLWEIFCSYIQHNNIS
jgi:hypothetical protein